MLERGRMLAWLRESGKNKVPRMMNDRSVVERILATK